LIVTLVPLAILESRRTPDWLYELSRYLANTGSSVEAIRLAEMAEAQHPEQFAAQMLIAAPVGWPWQGIDRIPPPEKVRCIRIEGQGRAGWGSTGQAITERLLVGYHSDGLWHTGWLVHRFREGVSDAAQQALLAKMGCKQWAAVSALMPR
jgi:hypothetical protein